MDKVIAELKVEAAKLGANGLMLEGFSDAQTASAGTAWSHSPTGKYGARRERRRRIRRLQEDRQSARDLRAAGVKPAGGRPVGEMTDCAGLAPGETPM